MPRPSVIRFGPFTADLDSGELRRESSKIRLQAQPFAILTLLLHRPGEVITRDEIRQKLWPADTFVDFDHSLGTAINKIRAALRDSAERPRFIETLPKRGYRFIGEITPSEQPSIPVGAVIVNPKTPSRLPLLAGISLSIFAALALSLAYRRAEPRTLQSGPHAGSPIPFTVLPGNEVSPAFSPDGSRIAFGWDGGSASAAKGFDLYVKAIGSETLLRLTQRPSEWISPAWSPDGTQIAFHRMAGGETGLYVVPALGGQERKLRSTRVPYSVAAPISWSADGKRIAFSEPLPNKPEDRMFLLNMETLETTQISHNPKCLHEADATFSHKGDRLAYLCVHSTSEFELYAVALSGGRPKLITAFSNFPIGLSWSSDDKRVIFSEASESGLGPVLYEVTVADGSSRRLDFAVAATWPALSPKGGKLAYSGFTGKANIWRLDLLHPQSPAVQLIGSTRTQEAAQYSPDGQHIAFTSDRAGYRNIWMSDADGRNLVQLSNLPGSSDLPRWSPDSKKVAFESYDSSSRSIYIVDVAERIPKKLLTNIAKVAAPSWSSDGKWIYFRSYEILGHKIYRCPAAGGSAVPLGGEPDGISPQESLKGDTLYFAARNVNTALRTISLTGTFPEAPIDKLPPVAGNKLWHMVPGGIYFVPANASKSVDYFDFTTEKIRKILDAPKDFGDALSVSPDGRWLLYAQEDEENTDIMLVENLR